jgi:hypothetical protein
MPLRIYSVRSAGVHANPATAQQQYSSADNSLLLQAGCLFLQNINNEISRDDPSLIDECHGFIGNPYKHPKNIYKFIGFFAQPTLF